MTRLSSSRLSETLMAVLVVALLAVPSTAISPDTTDARAIMEAVEARPRADRVSSRIMMQVIDKAGRKRTRVVESRSKLFEGGTKQLVLFAAPADVRNTGLLSIDYDAGDKDDDQWLYLPSLRKSTRISASSRSGSFMGTDLSYSDMTKQDPASYDYGVVEQSAPVDGEDCWLIEARPRTEKAKRETGYVKLHVWVSKDKLVPLKVKNWVREGRKLKLIKFADIKKVGGIWIPHKILAQTVRAGTVQSRTVMVFKDLAVNAAHVTDGDFTQRRLEQGL